MTQGTDSATAGERPSAYERLGVSPDSSFDEVQAAKSARLAELGDDPQARAQIEAAYDAVLMDRLKERQQGKVSSAALNASQREAVRPVASPPPPPLSRPSLPSLPSLPRPSLSVPQLSLPVLALAEGRERWFPLVADGLVLLLLLFLPPGPSAELLLALATGVTVVTPAVAPPPLPGGCCLEFRPAHRGPAARWPAAGPAGSQPAHGAAPGRATSSGPARPGLAAPGCPADRLSPPQAALLRESC